jgi:hypothetical protein
MPTKTTTAPRTVKAVFTAGTVVINAAAEGQKIPTFTATAYAGGAMQPHVKPALPHPVVIDLSGVSARKPSLPVLRDHLPGRHLGHTTELQSTGRELLAQGVMSGGGTDAAEVVSAAKSGFTWGVSVGAELGNLEFVGEGKTVNVNGRTIDGPVFVARRSRVNEISFLTIAADPDASVSIAARQGKFMAKRINQPATAIIPTDDTADEIGTTTIAATGDDDQLIEKDLRAIRREETITKLCAEFPHIAKAADESKWDERQIVCAIRAAKLERDLPRSVQIIQRAPRTNQAATMEAAMCIAAGLGEEFTGKQYGEQATNDALTKDYKNFGIHAAMFHVIRAANMSAPGYRVDADFIRTAFDASHKLQAAGYSTIGLPGILGNVANKSAIASFNAVPVSWKKFCAIESNKDFKQATRYRLTGTGSYQKVAPGGDIKHVGMTEESYTSTLDTEGALIVFQRKDIINDDLGKLATTGQMLGRMGAVAIDKEAVQLLMSNPSSFFASGNSNYFEGSSTNLSVTSLATAEQKLLKQQDANGDPAFIVGSVLLVPPELSTTATSLTRDTELRDTTASTKYTTGNPHFGKFTPEVSPWLSNQSTDTGYSTTAWYLLANPNDIAVEEVAFLNGVQTPTVESGDTNYQTLGFYWRAYHDFSASLRDYRGGCKSKGAA